MPTPPFVYQDPLPLGADDTEYRLLSKEGVTTATFEGKEVLKVAPEALAYLKHFDLDPPAASFDAAFGSDRG